MCYIKQLLIFFCVSLFSAQYLCCLEKNLESVKKIEMAVELEQYELLGTLLKECANKTVTFKKIKKIAKHKGSIPLLRALQAAETIYSEKNRLGLGIGEFLQIGIFMETRLAQFIDKQIYYLIPSETNLACAVEYDPVTGYRFIILSGKHGSFIGKGRKKIVVKAIRFDGKNSEILARAEQCKKLKREIEITKLLKGAPGVYRTLAFTSHLVEGNQYVAIYSKLYSPGSLAAVFENNIKFTIQEKSKIILNILEGLETLHKNNIIHTDLSPKNYLINISKIRPGVRDVRAAISDFGRSKFASESRNVSVQGNSLYIAPEGVFRKKLRGADYFATDIYAVGCVLYQLFYETQAPWQDQRYIKDTLRSQEENYKLLVQKINDATETRRNVLVNKRQRQFFTLSETLELLILRMLNPDPRRRGTAFELKEELQSGLVHLL